MKPKTIDEINNSKPSNSRLTALYRINNGVVAKCECGKIVESRSFYITSGRSISCGCYNSEQVKIRPVKYSHTIPRLKGIYHNMIRRCYDERCSHYHLYGGAGITVCEEWKNSYQSFLDWALTNGYSNELELDKDINGGGKKIYSPETCCWVTSKKNCNNRSVCIKYNFNGDKLTLSEISPLVKIPYLRLFQRIRKRGISLDEAIKMG